MEELVMPLFEFSVLVERNVVVWAEDKKKARAWFDDMTADGLSCYGDPGDLKEIDLAESRPGTKDDAHVVA
jgi:hypothetical protein